MLYLLLGSPMVYVEEKLISIDKVLDILEDLVDLQNGPPLLRYEKEWLEVMDRAEKILGRKGRGYEGQREK